MAPRALAHAQKKAEQEGRTILWVDESGFALLPAVVRTYAPCGQTPILRARLSHDHLSAISGITASGKLYLKVQERAYTSEGVVCFLRHLLRHVGGKLLVIWDGSPIHRGQPVQEFLTRGEGQDLEVEQLPGYAPELNPDEGIWRYLKRVELKNVCCSQLSELRYELRKAVARLRHRGEILLGCLRQPGYIM